LAAARQADLGPLPFLVGLAAKNPQAQPIRVHHHVFDAERCQFGAAERAGETKQQQRAVAPAPRGVVAGREQHRQRQGGCLLGFSDQGRISALGPARGTTTRSV
jgi:hypothetical protein